MGPTGQFILLLFFVAHELPRCHCIRCYMCTHNTGVPWDDKGCIDVDQHDMTHHLLRACPPFPPNHVNFNKCIFYKLYNGTAVPRLVRDCGATKTIGLTDLGCKKMSWANYEAEECVCQTDGCNGASSVRISLAILQWMILIFYYQFISIVVW